MDGETDGEKKLYIYIKYFYTCIYKEIYYKKFSYITMDAKFQVLQLTHCKYGKSLRFSLNPKAEIN